MTLTLLLGCVVSAGGFAVGSSPVWAAGNDQYVCFIPAPGCSLFCHTSVSAKNKKAVRELQEQYGASNVNCTRIKLNG